jgi:nitrite reductase (NO-forming)
MCAGLDERPTYVVFNGREGALTEAPLLVKAGDRVRLFVVNAGPNLVSSFHCIGSIFDCVYKEGDLVSPPARTLQTTAIPAGGAAVVELDALVPGKHEVRFMF